MNSDQWADAIDKMVTGLEQYNASMRALSKKSTNDTQPLAPEQGPSLDERLQHVLDDQRARRDEKQAGQDAREMMQEAYERIHVHGPFVFLMNQNHNALRGCVTCGATWVGLMAGAEENLVWHPVGEMPEEEGE